MFKSQMITQKKAMTAQLTSVAYGIIGLAIVVGIGLVVLTKLGDTVVSCPATLNDTGAAIWNTTLQLCQNSSGATASGLGSAYTSMSYAVTQLGSTGLLSWLPAVIALVIGVLFLAMFMGRKKTY